MVTTATISNSGNVNQQQWDKATDTKKETISNGGKDPAGIKFDNPKLK